MSLVGPRPHAPNTRAEGFLLEDAVADYAERHRIKPGITGWAQVNGARGEIKTIEQVARRLRYDMEYIRNWTPGLDIKILFLTLAREIISSRAF
jgi:lipopolysaccharide/colanic/teichoic acid biosynthesis glycosyltransferase